MQTDRKIRQIYLELPVCAAPSDTLKAYNKLEDIRKDIERGKVDFATAAKNYSEDERSAGNGGLIGWFTAPNAALNFERAVYDAPVGGLSHIVRSSIGYHLIMVEEERPARGRVEVSHIFVSADASNSGSVEIARKRILEAKEKPCREPHGKRWCAPIPKTTKQLHGQVNCRPLESMSILRILSKRPFL